MTKHIPLQTYLPAHVAAWIREGAPDVPTASKRSSLRGRQAAKDDLHLDGPRQTTRSGQKARSAQQSKSVDDDRDPMKEQREGAIGERKIEDRDDMDI